MPTTMFAVCLMLTLAATATTSYEISKEWSDFKLQHQKVYANASEEEYRFNVFADNYKVVVENKQLYHANKVTFMLDVNQFSDMHAHEVAAARNGYIRRNQINEESIMFKRTPGLTLPKQVNWAETGAVTKVKDQGNCGSCWSFSATGSIEGQHYRATKQLMSLSEQNLLDCSSPEGNHGCDGGDFVYAFEYVQQNKGIDKEHNYPYKARVQDMCHYSAKYRGATVRGHVMIARDDENALKEAVATVGPISVAIDASLHSFQAYKKGVYHDPNCSVGHVDHAVLVVGYGTDGKQDYWLVKNSWGKKWGEHGYIRMARNRNNTCCIACAASYPLV